VLSVVESADADTGELRRDKFCVARLDVPLGNLEDAVERLRRSSMGEEGGEFFRIGSSLCHPSRWREARASLVDAWHLAGHHVHWEDGEPALFLWCEPDVEQGLSPAGGECVTCG
jgi:hypothetical protein